MSNLSSDRQFGIWRSRIFREFDKCTNVSRECPGAELYELFVDEVNGVAIARFRVFVPFRDGSSALRMVPLTALEVSMPFEANRTDATFPFSAPRVCAYVGAEYLPREMRHKCGNTGEWLVDLPTLTRWSPSNTLVMVLQDFVAIVQQSDPQPTQGAPESGPHGTSVEGYLSSTDNRNKRLRMRKRDIFGAIYHCEEVDPRTGMLRPVPMLLQSGNIVFLVPPPSKTAAVVARRSGGDADVDYVYVSDLFPLKDVARITPQRGKSITFFFKNQQSCCRTLLTSQTESIISDIQRMIAAVGSKRAREDDTSRRGHHRRNEGRDVTSPALDDGPFSQLLSFLSPDHSEKAKEVSSKIVGKLSRWGSSVTRFFKGDDDAHDPESTHPGRNPAFQELDRMKSEFFHYPSRAKMLAITTRYQKLAEDLAKQNTRDGQVEKTIEEMQTFIEHPTTQRLLLESYAVDHAQRGIRVGSL